MIENSSNTLDMSLFKVSSMGTNVDDLEDKLKVDFEYTSLAHFFVWFFGTTRMPVKICFTCIASGEIFETLTDKKLIEHYMLYCRK